MNTVNTHLPLDDQNEDEQVITVGDDILAQFYYGNYSDAIDMMIRDWIRPAELAEYLEDKAMEYDVQTCDIYGNHFTLSFFANVGESFQIAHLKEYESNK